MTDLNTKPLASASNFEDDSPEYKEMIAKSKAPLPAPINLPHTSPASMTMKLDQETEELTFNVVPGYANGNCPEVTELEDGRMVIDGMGVLTLHENGGFVITHGPKNTVKV
jgi:hypothetical protein